MINKENMVPTSTTNLPPQSSAANRSKAPRSSLRAANSSRKSVSFSASNNLRTFNHEQSIIPSSISDQTVKTNPQINLDDSNDQIDVPSISPSFDQLIANQNTKSSPIRVWNDHFIQVRDDSMDLTQCVNQPTKQPINQITKFKFVNSAQSSGSQAIVNSRSSGVTDACLVDEDMDFTGSIPTFQPTSHSQLTHQSIKQMNERMNSPMPRHSIEHTINQSVNESINRLSEVSHMSRANLDGVSMEFTNHSITQSLLHSREQRELGVDLDDMSMDMTQAFMSSNQASKQSSTVQSDNRIQPSHQTSDADLNSLSMDITRATHSIVSGKPIVQSISQPKRHSSSPSANQSNNPNVHQVPHDVNLDEESMDFTKAIPVFKQSLEQPINQPNHPSQQLVDDFAEQSMDMTRAIQSVNQTSNQPIVDDIDIAEQSMEFTRALPSIKQLNNQLNNNPALSDVNLADQSMDITQAFHSVKSSAAGNQPIVSQPTIQPISQSSTADVDLFEKSMDFTTVISSNKQPVHLTSNQSTHFSDVIFDDQSMDIHSAKPVTTERSLGSDVIFDDQSMDMTRAVSSINQSNNQPNNQQDIIFDDQSMDITRVVQSVNQSSNHSNKQSNYQPFPSDVDLADQSMDMTRAIQPTSQTLKVTSQQPATFDANLEEQTMDMTAAIVPDRLPSSRSINEIIPVDINIEEESMDFTRAIQSTKQSSNLLPNSTPAVNLEEQSMDLTSAIPLTKQSIHQPSIQYYNTAQQQSSNAASKRSDPKPTIYRASQGDMELDDSFDEPIKRTSKRPRRSSNGSANQLVNSHTQNQSSNQTVNLELDDMEMTTCLPPRHNQPVNRSNIQSTNQLAPSSDFDESLYQFSNPSINPSNKKRLSARHSLTRRSSVNESINRAMGDDTVALHSKWSKILYQEPALIDSLIDSNSTQSISQLNNQLNNQTSFMGDATREIAAMIRAVIVDDADVDKYEKEINQSIKQSIEHKSMTSVLTEELIDRSFHLFNLPQLDDAFLASRIKRRDSSMADNQANNPSMQFDQSIGQGSNQSIDWECLWTSLYVSGEVEWLRIHCFELIDSHQTIKQTIKQSTASIIDTTNQLKARGLDERSINLFINQSNPFSCVLFALSNGLEMDSLSCTDHQISVVDRLFDYCGLLAKHEWLVKKQSISQANYERAQQILTLLNEDCAALQELTQRCIHLHSINQAITRQRSIDQRQQLLDDRLRVVQLKKSLEQKKQQSIDLSNKQQSLKQTINQLTEQQKSINQHNESIKQFNAQVTRAQSMVSKVHSLTQTVIQSMTRVNNQTHIQLVIGGSQLISLFVDQSNDQSIVQSIKVEDTSLIKQSNLQPNKQFHPLLQQAFVSLVEQSINQSVDRSIRAVLTTVQSLLQRINQWQQITSINRSINPLNKHIPTVRVTLLPHSSSDQSVNQSKFVVALAALSAVQKRQLTIHLLIDESANRTNKRSISLLRVQLVDANKPYVDVFQSQQSISQTINQKLISLVSAGLSVTDLFHQLIEQIKHYIV